jgi:hypothetical protein
MPRYLHIPHTPDTARTLTLSGRNCLVVSGIVTPPLKPATGAEKGADETSWPTANTTDSYRLRPVAVVSVTTE